MKPYRVVSADDVQPQQQVPGGNAYGQPYQHQQPPQGGYSQQHQGAVPYGQQQQQQQQYYGGQPPQSVYPHLGGGGGGGAGGGAGGPTSPYRNYGSGGTSPPPGPKAASGVPAAGGYGAPSAAGGVYGAPAQPGDNYYGGGPYGGGPGYGLPQQPQGYPPGSDVESGVKPGGGGMMGKPGTAGVGVAATEGKDKFNYAVGQYRDLWCMILFYVQLVIIIALAGTFGGAFARFLDFNHVGDGGRSGPAAKAGFCLLLAALTGLAFGGAWLFIIQKYASIIVKISMVMSIAMLVIAGIFNIIAGSLGGALFIFILAAFTAFYFYMVRSRIAFTQAVIAASVSSLRMYWGPFYVVIFLAVLQIGWTLLWAFTSGAIDHHMYSNPDGTRNGNPGWWLVLLLLISLYWTAEVIRNVGHTTTAGVVATWWWDPSHQKANTRASLKRALTTSFGSICFGSLMVAILQALRALLNSAKQSAADSRNVGALCAIACADCILGIVEGLIRFFNVYAYTFVAVYGYDFMTAARNTWDLFRARGIDVFVNSDLTGMVTGMGSLVGGLLGALVSGLIFYSIRGNDRSSWVVVTPILGFSLAYLTTTVLLSVISSAVATTYVVYAEDPELAIATRPAEGSAIAQADKYLTQ